MLAATECLLKEVSFAVFFLDLNFSHYLYDCFFPIFFFFSFLLFFVFADRNLVETSITRLLSELCVAWRENIAW